ATLGSGAPYLWRHSLYEFRKYRPQVSVKDYVGNYSFASCNSSVGGAAALTIHLPSPLEFVILVAISFAIELSEDSNLQGSRLPFALLLAAAAARTFWICDVRAP
ncbi:MAG TPA: hypothetical protein VFR42_00755, partial [Candidatus Acidoferrum sp.]|nr:hypothetical protein [Candidatus Acidoferrum sp.]